MLYLCMWCVHAHIFTSLALIFYIHIICGYPVFQVLFIEEVVLQPFYIFGVILAVTS